jgi:hypothetical protein
LPGQDALDGVTQIAEPLSILATPGPDAEFHRQPGRLPLRACRYAGKPFRPCYASGADYVSNAEGLGVSADPGYIPRVTDVPFPGRPGRCNTTLITLGVVISHSSMVLDADKEIRDLAFSRPEFGAGTRRHYPLKDPPSSVWPPPVAAGQYVTQARLRS